MTIADRIQSLRKQKGMSQIELADAIGVSRQAVSKWESEQAIPDLDKIIAMSEIFGTTTDYLLKGIEPVDVETEAAKDTLPRMSKEESIKYVEKLSHEYRSLEKLKTQISDNERILSKPFDASYPQHAAFKFFWPFFIYAVLAYIAMLVITAIFVSKETGALMIILCYAVPIGVLIGGGVHACRKRDILNAEESELARSRRDRHDLLRKETAEMKSKLSILEERLKKIDTAVPSELKNSACMDKAKTLLERGKADNIEEAFKLCVGK